MMGGKDKVCPRCGKKIPSSEDYCLECSGAVFIDEDKQRILDREYRVRKADSRAKMASILAGLYSAVCIIGGALAVISTDTVVSLMKCFFSNDQWIYVMGQIGVATEKELKELLVSSGYLALVSGLLALVASVTTHIRKHWSAAIAFTIAAAVVIFLGFTFAPKAQLVGVLISDSILLVIGLLVAYTIFVSRAAFIAREA
jgi:hypothetical protein